MAAHRLDPASFDELAARHARLELLAQRAQANGHAALVEQLIAAAEKVRTMIAQDNHARQEDTVAYYTNLIRETGMPEGCVARYGEGPPVCSPKVPRERVTAIAHYHVRVLARGVIRRRVVPQAGSRPRSHRPRARAQAHAPGRPGRPGDDEPHEPDVTPPRASLGCASNSGGTIALTPLQLATVALLSSIGTARAILDEREQEAWVDALIAVTAREAARILPWRAA